jgi:hypothetical protein
VSRQLDKVRQTVVGSLVVVGTMMMARFLGGRRLRRLGMDLECLGMKPMVLMGSQWIHQSEVGSLNRQLVPKAGSLMDLLGRERLDRLIQFRMAEEFEDGQQRGMERQRPKHHQRLDL